MPVGIIIMVRRMNAKREMEVTRVANRDNPMQTPVQTVEATLATMRPRTVADR